MMHTIKDRNYKDLTEVEEILFCIHSNSIWVMEKAMAPHSSTLAWKIAWTEKPGGLQSMGSQRATERLHFHSHYNLHFLDEEMIQKVK